MFYNIYVIVILPFRIFQNATTLVRSMLLANSLLVTMAAATVIVELVARLPVIIHPVVSSLLQIIEHIVL